jgi:hypothetical protein
MNSEDAYEDASQWGGYAADAVFDNENWDDPRREMEWNELLSHAPTFKTFCYQNADLEKDKLFALVTSPMFAGVEFLDLRRNFRSPDDELMAELVRSGHLKHLRYLSLDNCYQVGDATLQAIASGAIPNLERLALDSTSVTDAGLAALAGSTQTPKLQHVQGMMIESISEGGVAELVRRRPQLTLSLTRN